jgi:hypothetical protein
VDPRLIWILAVAAIVIAVGVVWYEFRRRRSDTLRTRFGTEYDHAVHTAGDVKKAEASLEARARRVEALHIRPLTPDEATRYGHSWRRVQERFVDDPNGAVQEADRLVGEVMQARGYPLGDFEQRVEDISVDHPGVVMHYRAAREIAQTQAAGTATTEDLRQAMVHYRALFDDLLEIEHRDLDRHVEHEQEISRGRR